MANVIRITVDGVEDLLTSGMYDAGAIVRLQSCATQTGTYANESTAALVAGTRIYTLYDADGTSSTWYRTRYENSGGSSYSDWSPVFQVGGEEAGLICSLYDVKQRLEYAPSDTSHDEEILELIRQVTTEIEYVTGRDFTGYRSDTTILANTTAGRVLWLTQGIQSVTTLGYATQDQPDSGGSYTTIPATAYTLQPSGQERDPGWPATRIVLLSTSGIEFANALNGAQITGKPGWAEVPGHVARIAAGAVVGAFLGKGVSGPRAVVGPEGRTTILRDISPADWATLMTYRVEAAG